MRLRTADAARNKWKAILIALGIPESVLDGRHHPCPRNGEGTDRFRFTDRETVFCHCTFGGDPFELLKCCNGWDFARAAQEVDKIVGNVEMGQPKAMIDARPALERAWKETYRAGDEVARYLQSRGLVVAPSLRGAHRDYWDIVDGQVVRRGKYHCMVAKIQNKIGEGVSLHITYLLDGKKAPVDAPRKIMSPIGTINGAAIRLYAWEPEEPIGIAEGIESAIAAGILHNCCVWAVMNRNGMETFEPPEGAKKIHIYGDNDRSYAGQAGAYRGAERLVRLGYDVDVLIPDAGDWNDVLLASKYAERK